MKSQAEVLKTITDFLKQVGKGNELISGFMSDPLPKSYHADMDLLFKALLEIINRAPVEYKVDNMSFSLEWLGNDFVMSYGYSDVDNLKKAIWLSIVGFITYFNYNGGYNLRNYRDELNASVREEIKGVCKDNLEANVLMCLISNLYAEKGFSDVESSDIACRLHYDEAVVNAAISGLEERGLVSVGEGHFKGIIYLNNKYHYLHPKWYNQ